MSEATAPPSVRDADAVRNGAADPLLSEIARSDVYRLLAACFCAPQREALLGEELPEQLRRALELVCPAAVEHAVRLAHALQSASQRELEVEYARLFVGPGPLPAPPFGSVYLDGDHAVMGPSTLAVAELYEQAGLTMDGEGSDPPDHISAELEFAYFLTRESARRLQSGEDPDAGEIDSLELEFIECYVLPWVPRFCDDIAAHSESEYFRSLAAVLKSFLVVFERVRLDSGAESREQ